MITPVEYFVSNAGSLIFFGLRHLVSADWGDIRCGGILVRAQVEDTI
ncbi:hypothetical protein DSUL_20169 [Desulfovibrionales bacterium]